MDEKKDNKLVPNLWKWIQRDGLYISVLLLALIAMTWTYYNTANYIQDCNDHWQEQWNNNIANNNYSLFTEQRSLADWEYPPFINDNED